MLLDIENLPIFLSLASEKGKPEKVSAENRSLRNVCYCFSALRLRHVSLTNRIIWEAFPERARAFSAPLSRFPCELSFTAPASVLVSESFAGLLSAQKFSANLRTPEATSVTIAMLISSCAI